MPSPNQKKKKKYDASLLRRLHLQDKYENKLTSAEFLQIKPTLKHEQGLSESDLCSVYLHKLLMLDYRARYIQAKQENTNVTTVCQYTDDLFATIENLSKVLKQTNIHPLDLQMAVFHCSDSFLKQKMVTKLSQCQYALPLLVPDPFTGDIECPLWTFRQINKTWKKTETKDNETVVTMKSMSICKAETLMVLCFRLGSLSGSKSQLINTLINDRHSTFFHRNSTGSSKNRLLLDGVAEIAWYCPSGKPTDSFTDCVAFCNLHGDGLTHHKQREILMDKASVNVVFVPTLDKKHESAPTIKDLIEFPKPLIALIESSGNSVIQLQHKTGKYIVGLNDRSLSDVSEELKSIIREIVSAPHDAFQLESMSDTGLRADEHDASCKKGFSSAETIMKIIKSVSVSEDKQDFLPCQSQLWHDWSRINKELYHLKGNVEEERSKKLNECKKLREDQCTAYCGELMMYFVEKLSPLDQTEREYFIKWTQILLDDHTMNRLSSILQNYNQKWSEVSEDHKETLKELVKLSQDLQSATCGLEHIFREMAQIYEAHKSLDKPPGQGPSDWSKYPELAAELMISGHPMELMDGDAGHVPLTWISGLIDQVIKKLGNKRVFVLSVLGIQSSGKSTMLNVMFGLQFAVSAGRCTRGAFMQLVKLSEEMKTGFQWDFILVVDTEGLRALELEGNKTIQHDNELATFVVGLGNMTLVNIFGENPSDMQDVLQIVVQAFMRMKKVRLSPSCVFVHQNVSDVSATEKNMNGKRKLLEKLDKMVQLAAKEEVCDAESFSDIIEFDVQKDVKYFAQLWEGSPPMAPPNPGYSECVQDLKSFILEKAKKSPGLTFSDFKTKLEDLWNALLNENFVFSFKNTLEIAVYRKLEVQYGNWTWALRSEMLKIEEKLYTRISNGELDHVNLSHLYGEVTKKYEETKLLMSEYFDSEEDKDMLIQWRAQHELKLNDFLDELVRGLPKKLNNVIEQKKASKEAEEKKTMFENNLLQKSKKLALKLRDNSRDDQELESHFNHVWESWVSDLTRGIKPADKINLEEDQIQAIHEHGFEIDSMINRKNSQQYKTIAECGDYTEYVAKKHYESHNIVIRTFVNAKERFLTGRLSHEHQEQIKNLITDVEKQASELIKQKPVVERGYSSSYLREMCSNVISSIAEFESQWKYLLLKEFKVDLILFVFYKTHSWILESHSQFLKNNDVRTYLERKKDEYYSVFRSFYKGSSSAVVLTEVICDKLKSSMTEAVCNQTAIDIAGDMKCNVPEFKENRLNLEKHVLKSLAEKRDFNRYIIYIRNPKTYTETFIREEVENLLHTEYKDKCNSVFKQKISNIQKQILHALHEASETTKENNGDINMWLQVFTGSIKGELTFGTIDPQNFTDVNDFDFLGEEIEKGLNSISVDLSNLSVDKFKNSRQRPDQILIDQLCDCCWETCPFCAAVCTNTIKDHKSAKDGGMDHSTPFHRSASVNGVHYRGTKQFSLPFCTTEVAGDRSFYPDSSNRTVPYKQYRTAGTRYETWSITPDLHQMSYWQWVVCTFQKEIEKHYNLKYEGEGKIPVDWRKVTEDQALKNLEKMYK
uniref:VLIG-type G domain-containing protein n=1 Tax=Neogobius melanostomus TaxID=47308 RepID=A0A8C6SWT8_9GOBI